MNMNRRRQEAGRELRKRGSRRGAGQSMVEFALMVPFLIVLMAGTMQYSRLFNSAQLTASILREGIRYAAKHGTESQTKYLGTAKPSDDAIRAYMRDIADDTGAIKRADLPDANITISPALGSSQRAAGNAITITMSYDMRKQIFLPNFLPGLSRIGVSTETASMIIE